MSWETRFDPLPDLNAQYEQDFNEEEERKPVRGEGTNWITDSILGVGRGVAGAIEGIAELPTVIPGIEYDIKDNFGLGHSKTIPGSLVEGFTQFLTGYYPAGLGLATWGARATKGLTAGAKVSKKAKFANAMVNSAAARGMVGGAIADISIFTSDEERLSNLFANIPETQDSILAILAAEEDDTALEGRLKNVLEGAALGGLFEGIFGIVRGIRNRRKLIANKDSMPLAELERKLRIVNQDIEDSAGDGLAKASMGEERYGQRGQTTEERIQDIQDAFGETMTKEKAVVADSILRSMGLDFDDMRVAFGKDGNPSRTSWMQNPDGIIVPVKSAGVWTSKVPELLDELANADQRIWATDQIIGWLEKRISKGEMFWASLYGRMRGSTHITERELRESFMPPEIHVVTGGKNTKESEHIIGWSKERIKEDYSIDGPKGYSREEYSSLPEEGALFKEIMPEWYARADGDIVHGPTLKDHKERVSKLTDEELVNEGMLSDSHAPAPPTSGYFETGRSEIEKNRGFLPYETISRLGEANRMGKAEMPTQETAVYLRSQETGDILTYDTFWRIAGNGKKTRAWQEERLRAASWARMKKEHADIPDRVLSEMKEKPEMPRGTDPVAFITDADAEGWARKWAHNKAKILGSKTKEEGGYEELLKEAKAEEFFGWRARAVEAFDKEDAAYQFSYTLPGGFNQRTIAVTVDNPHAAQGSARVLEQSSADLRGAWEKLKMPDRMALARQFEMAERLSDKGLIGDAGQRQSPTLGLEHPFSEEFNLARVILVDKWRIDPDDLRGTEFEDTPFHNALKTWFNSKRQVQLRKAPTMQQGHDILDLGNSGMAFWTRGKQYKPADKTKGIVEHLDESQSDLFQQGNTFGYIDDSSVRTSKGYNPDVEGVATIGFAGPRGSGGQPLPGSVAATAEERFISESFENEITKRMKMERFTEPIKDTGPVQVGKYGQDSLYRWESMDQESGGVFKSEVHVSTLVSEQFLPDNFIALKDAMVHKGTKEIYGTNMRDLLAKEREAVELYRRDRVSDKLTSSFYDEPSVGGVKAEQPFRKYWVDMALQVRLMHAIKSGATMFTWATGKQQIYRNEQAWRTPVDTFEYGFSYRGGMWPEYDDIPMKVQQLGQSGNLVHIKSSALGQHKGTFDIYIGSGEPRPDTPLRGLGGSEPQDMLKGDIMRYEPGEIVHASKHTSTRPVIGKTIFQVFPEKVSRQIMAHARAKVKSPEQIRRLSGKMVGTPTGKVGSAIRRTRRKKYESGTPEWAIGTIKGDYFTGGGIHRHISDKKYPQVIKKMIKDYNRIAKDEPGFKPMKPPKDHYVPESWLENGVKAFDKGIALHKKLYPRGNYDTPGTQLDRAATDVMLPFPGLTEFKMSDYADTFSLKSEFVKPYDWNKYIDEPTMPSSFDYPSDGFRWKNNEIGQWNSDVVHTNNFKQTMKRIMHDTSQGVLPLVENPHIRPFEEFFNSRQAFEESKHKIWKSEIEGVGSITVVERHGKVTDNFAVDEVQHTKYAVTDIEPQFIGHWTMYGVPETPGMGKDSWEDAFTTGGASLTASTREEAFESALSSFSADFRMRWGDYLGGQGPKENKSLWGKNPELWHQNMQNQQFHTQPGIELNASFRRHAEKYGFKRQYQWDGKPKGYVDIESASRAYIAAMKGGDFSTIVHELAHVSRSWLFDRSIPAEARRGITEKEISIAERWSGAESPEHWGREAEEKFARGFEKYLYDGKAPKAGLQGVFDKIASWMQDVYKNISGSTIDVEISPEMREVYDKLMLRGDLPNTKPSPHSKSVSKRFFQSGKFDPHGLDDYDLPYDDVDLSKLLAEDGYTPQAGKQMAESLDAALRNEEFNPMHALRGWGNLGTLSDRTNAVVHYKISKWFADKNFTIDSKNGKIVKVKNFEDFKKAAFHSAHKMLDMPYEQVVAKVTKGGMEINQAVVNLHGTMVMMDFQVQELLHMGKVAISQNPEQQAADLLKMSNKLGKHIDAEDLMGMVAAGMERYSDLLAATGFVKSQLGTGLGSLRGGRPERMLDEGIRTTDGIADRAIRAPDYKNLLEKAGGKDQMLKTIQKFLKASRDGTDIITGSRWLQKIARRRLLQDMTFEWWVNSLIGKAVTWATNAIGNTAIAFYAPTELLWGARIQRAQLKKEPITLVSGEALATVERQIQHTELQIQYLTKMWRDSVEVAKLTYKTGDPQLLKGEHSQPFDPHVRRGTLTTENLRKVLPTRNQRENFDPAGKLGVLFSRLFEKGLGPHEIGFTTPSKVLLSTDEAFKQVNYRSWVAAELNIQARENGLTGEKVDLFIQNKLDNFARNGEAMTEKNLLLQAQREFPVEDFSNPFVRKERMDKWIEGRINDPDVRNSTQLVNTAVKVSEERTWTNRLDPTRGLVVDAGKTVQGFSKRHPTFKLMFPFIRTPVNLVAYAIDRINPLPIAEAAIHKMGQTLGVMADDSMQGAWSKLTRELGGSDLEVRSEAMGRLVGGMGFMAMAGMAAINGTLTGSGPKDRDYRNILRRTGWQPYSLKVGDTYISYQRLDPFATMLGVVGDLGDIARFSAEEDQGFLETAVIGTMISIVDNLQSKSYLQGLVQLTDMMNPDASTMAEGKKIAGRITGSMLIPGMISQFANVQEDTLLASRGFVDQILNKIPVLSGAAKEALATTDVQRTILGDKVTKKTFSGPGRDFNRYIEMALPFITNHTGNNIIDNELALLEFGFSLPLRTKYGLVLTDYTGEGGQSAYDYWLERSSITEIGGRSLRNTLTRLIRSSAYQELPISGVERLDEDSPRILAISKVISKFRSVALDEMLDAFPDIKKAARDKLIARRAMRTGTNPNAIIAELFPLDY